MMTAIILFGHLRTWNLCKEHLIKSMNEIYGNDVHWYISIWKTNTGSAEDLKAFFDSKGQTVIGFKVIDQAVLPIKDKIFQNDWAGMPMGAIGPSYLRQLASRDKRIHEFQNGFIYNRVIFTRPDVIYYYDKNTIVNSETIEDEKNFALQLRGDFEDIAFPVAGPSAHDVMPIAGMMSSDVYGFMFLDSNSDFEESRKVNLRLGCIHSWMSTYCKKHFITVDARRDHFTSERNIWPKVIRPTIKDIEQVYQEHDSWNGEFFSPGYDELWNNDPDSYYKKKFCLKLGIDLQDYGLDKL